MGEYGIGQSVPREEDPYLVQGHGRYVDDVTANAQLRGYVLRSPHGHAVIKSIDTTAAKAMPGVQLVLTGRDETISSLGKLKPLIPRKKADGPATLARISGQSRLRLSDRRKGRGRCCVREGRAQVEHGPGGVTPPQHDPRERDALQDSARLHL